MSLRALVLFLLTGKQHLELERAQENHQVVQFLLGKVIVELMSLAREYFQ